MSFITYNGITMQLVRTLRFEQEAVYDEDQTTYLWTRFLLEADCIYNPAATSYSVTNPPTATPVDAPVTDVAIRHYLKVPRKQLVFTVGPYTLLSSPLASYVTDAHNGPMPRDVIVRTIHGSKTFAVRFLIETSLLECPATPGEGPALVSHRWTESHAVDQDYFTVRTMRGRAKFRSDLLLNTNIAPDDFRSTLVAPIPLGFKRENISVTATSDGTELLYEVVDRETYQPLGQQSSVTRCEAHYRYGSLKGGGMSQDTMLVRVWGRPRAAKNSLYTFAMRVLLSRTDPINRVAEQFEATESLFEPFIEVSAVTRGTPSKTTLGQYVAIPATFAQPGIGTLIPATELLNPIPADGVSRGDWMGRAVAAALVSPCGTTQSVLTTVGSESLVVNSIQTGPIVQVTTLTTSILPTGTTLFANPNPMVFYNSYHVDISYRRLQNRIQVPVAGANADSQIIDVAAPFTCKVVAGTAERVGNPPDLPLTDTGDANEVLLSDNVEPTARELLPDGQHFVYRTSFRYTYALRTQLGAGSTLKTAVTPLAQDSPAQTVLQASSFVDGIIGIGGQPGGGPTLHT
jgi:hypothetical protein